MSREIATPHGPARVHLHPVDGPRALLVLGHGAGGGVTAPDLVDRDEGGERGRDRRRARRAALPRRRAEVAAPAHQLDAAWTAVVDALRGDVPVLCGGRSSGARVACRTAAETGAAGVLCLAFPVHPPGRPEKTRLAELDAVAVPVLVVQGARDPFGMPPAAPGRTVAVVDGDHGLKKDRAGSPPRSATGWIGR